MIVLLLSLLIVGSYALPVSAIWGWEVIWEWEGILTEVPNTRQGYFITAFEDWPGGMLRREIRVEYLDGAKADGRGGSIGFVLIDFPDGGGWASWTSTICLQCPFNYYAKSESFVGEHTPDGAGIVWDGTNIENYKVHPLRARVQLRLLKPKFRLWIGDRCEKCYRF